MAMKPGSSLIGQGNEAVATCEGESESDDERCWVGNLEVGSEAEEIGVSAAILGTERFGGRAGFYVARSDGNARGQMWVGEWVVLLQVVVVECVWLRIAAGSCPSSTVLRRYLGGRQDADSPIGHSALTQQIRLAFPRLLADPGSLRTTKNYLTHTKSHSPVSAQGQASQPDLAACTCCT
jgi:hypothetical protein